MATHQAGWELKGTDAGKSVIGTFLIADGDRFGGTGANRFGDANQGAKGVRTAFYGLVPDVPKPRDVADPANTADICDRNDIVCDWSTKSVVAGVPIHLSHYQKPRTSPVIKAVAGMKDKINAQLKKAPVAPLRIDWLTATAKSGIVIITAKAASPEGFTEYTPATRTATALSSPMSSAGHRTGPRGPRAGTTG
ncbi:hypothetical protein GCM10023175_46610 [Pseudonocardia xishanensis]|uniref:Uncharacterized protein n=2 Tax=Pseudonocardia xishanensis TaxID=630995 RepID=A0ABP8RXQ6_9PSEU